MNDASAFGFGKFVPGFEFLQNLGKPPPQAASSAGMANWVAPTLSVEELDKRIQELKAVQFWLEQNGTALKATIQALEVQKMTLSTLQGMNVNMAELAKAFTAHAPTPPQPTAPTQAAQAPAPASEPPPQPAPTAKTTRRSKAQPDQGAAAVDPMQWWGALTQQFQNIAATALHDAAAQAAKARQASTPTTATATSTTSSTAASTATSTAATSATGRKTATKAASKTAPPRQARPTPSAPSTTRKRHA